MALNIVQRDFGDLFRSLDYDQGAPVGFLLLVKLVSSLPLPLEMALRLIPFVASILSLILLAAFLYRYASPRTGVIVAVTVYALSEHLVYYSAELKQYGVDAFVTVVLITAAYALVHSRHQRLWRMVLLVLGTFAPWLSHPAVFVIAAVVVFLVAMPRRSWLFVTSCLAAWGVSATAVYVVNVRAIAGNTFLTAYWQRYFAPFPRSPETLDWYVSSFTDLIFNPMGVSLAAAGLVVAILGIVSLGSTRPRLLLLVALPMVIAVAASAIRVYPFSGRLLMFATPLIAVMLAFGFQRISAPIDRIVLAIVLLLGPAITAGREWERPNVLEDVRTPARALLAEARPDDVVYVYYWAVPPSRLYGLGTLPPRGVTVIEGRDPGDNPVQALNEVKQLAGRQRVWVLFSHVFGNDERIIVDIFEGLGDRIDRRQYRNASLYLYDLSF